MRRVKRHLASFILWCCLFLACTGTSWFAYQYFFVPQAFTYTPSWMDSRWIQPVDITSPVAYYRYMTNFEATPDSAYIMLTANQVFRVYANGTFIGTNIQDFVVGDTPRTYIYDIGSMLTAGTNAIGIHIVDADKQSPQLRAVIETTWGNMSHYSGTNSSWHATGQTILAHPRNAATSFAWTLPQFDTTQWQSAQIVTPQPTANPLLTVNPIIYTYPQPHHWLSAYGGNDGYFVHQIDVPEQREKIFLRMAASGVADVFINGHQYMQWNGQPPVLALPVTDSLNSTDIPVVYQKGLITGVYDVTAYLHTGENTLAVHVQSPGSSTAKVGLEALKSALSMDLLISNGSATQNLLANDEGWHVSNQTNEQWTQAGSNTLQWPAPIPIARPGASSINYLPNNYIANNVQMIPPMLVAETLVYSAIAVLGVWLFIALILLRSVSTSRRAAFEAASLIFLPALVLEALLIVLAREPLLAHPFPYTRFWGLLLLLIVGCSALGLWIHARKMHHRLMTIRTRQSEASGDNLHYLTEESETCQTPSAVPETEQWMQRLISWSRQNWGLLIILLLAIPMACYNIGYEPFWQDELSSYNATRNIMMHGFPAFPSGFIYPKGELYSYLLAGFMFIFGTTGQVIPRTLSLAEYLISIPMLYLITQQLFNRKIAWLTTAMLALSPYDLMWSHQVRMYEQAQFMVIIVIYTLYRALQSREKKRPVYLALLCLLLAYLSHEENFIILPAALCCSLLATRTGPYGMPWILRKKHWWIPSLIVCALITIQLLVVYWTHPPTFATDQSREPQIGPSFNNLPYYFGLLFQTKTLKISISPWLLIQPWLLINSILAVLGCILAFLRKDRRPRYCALFFLIATGTLIFMFTMQADRYYYPLLPLYYMMGAYAFWSILDHIWRFAKPHLTFKHETTHTYPQVSLPIRIVMMTMMALLSASVLIFPTLPLNNYNQLISRALGLSYRHHFADYNNVGLYMKNHLQKGDIVVTIAPAVSILYYVKQVDYYFSIDRALFLIENNKQIVETTSGAHPMLNQQEFQNVLASNSRVWLITDDGGYQGGVTKNNRFKFPPTDFRMVYEGYGSAIYFRGGD
jgi:hypothetical protein